MNFWAKHFQIRDQEMPSFQTMNDTWHQFSQVHFLFGLSPKRITIERRVTLPICSDIGLLRVFFRYGDKRNNYDRFLIKLQGQTRVEQRYGKDVAFGGLERQRTNSPRGGRGRNLPLG